MSIFKKKKICVTHNGAFHPDDIFATAALSILEKGNIKIIRTRDPKIISKGDYVYDVGGEYDGVRFFDHHQKGGAGTRENGIPYSSFGLIWRSFGEKICGSREVAEYLDKKIVQTIDADDNGIDLSLSRKDMKAFTISDIVYFFRPTLGEEQNQEEIAYDKFFKKTVSIFKDILNRNITKAQDLFKSISFLKDLYQKSKDKKIIILDKKYSWQDFFTEYPEPIYVITPRVDGTWKVESVRKSKFTFESRKMFPESWAGKRDKELADVTGISDAIFCHNGRFMVVAKSKESAIKLAQKALLA
jgi:uncharacterized UPF0160 family protein